MEHFPLVKRFNGLKNWPLICNVCSSRWNVFANPKLLTKESRRGWPKVWMPLRRDL